MTSKLVEVLRATVAGTRDRSLRETCRGLDVEALLAECDALEAYRRSSDNLYERVRALFFLCAIHRDELPARPGFVVRGRVPYPGYRHLLARRFEEAIAEFLRAQRAQRANDAISSALAAAYHGLGFQTLADQVRRSVRSARGNRWMFRVGHPLDHPLRLRPALLQHDSADAPYPMLRERTPVRMDLTHSGWSDIFFLGMDHPAGARVLNASIALGVRGRDPRPEPPIECTLRVIDAPVLRLCSVDLGVSADIASLEELFDFARDHLGLLKAAVIASGFVPPGLEGCDRELAELLARSCGPNRGVEIVSRVRDIPKGSRLAVSTNLLASLIALCMRATGQTRRLTGPLDEAERRTVAARAILGEWLGGSGGGWQDSGGIWPGLKRIEGREAMPGDPEHGISRGCLLPEHTILDEGEFPPRARDALQRSLVLVHGGMAQNVGPVLEMVTEKYLLRSEPEWSARGASLQILGRVQDALRAADIDALARATSEHFDGPITTIVPWATNAFTEAVIAEARRRLGDGYRGFLMLGGMSGGGMGFFVDPALGESARDVLQDVLMTTKRAMQSALPFAMDPVVYDFAIDEVGTRAELLRGDAAWHDIGYYALTVPGLLRSDPARLRRDRRVELRRLAMGCRERPELAGLLPRLFESMLPHAGSTPDGEQRSLDELLRVGGFDAELHERVRTDLRTGRIGLAQNRLPASTVLEDVEDGDVVDTLGDLAPELLDEGRRAIASGMVAVVTLAGGAASRWTQGAGVVKALHPFCRFAARHRSFLELHVAKTRRVARSCGVAVPHVFTTSLFTHDAIDGALAALRDEHVDVLASPGRAVGLRLVPTGRDLRFLWEETAQQQLDERRQRVRESLHQALIAWSSSVGEASDYTDNLPLSCLHPVGHFFEVPNMLRNGVLLDLLARYPRLRWLMVHNVDTVGVTIDPARLALAIGGGADVTFEVIPRRIDDIGGGLARVDGRVRLVEGLAMPDEAAEFRLSYYNSGTAWVDVHALLRVFGLGRGDLASPDVVSAAIRGVAERLPTYVTIKDVKKRWGQGQEDVFPVAQFEKLWGDLTALSDVGSAFHVVPRVRGQQLKDPAQLEAFVRDGSAAAVDRDCEF